MSGVTENNGSAEAKGTNLAPAMNVALLHDWITGFRGGERVLEAFCEMFPASDLYTLVYAPGSSSEKIESRKIHASVLNSVPGIEKHYRKFLPFMPLAVDLMKVSAPAEVVLSSCHCVIKGVRKPQGAVHVSYIHSPMRYMYDQYDQYFGPGAPLLQRMGARACRDYLVSWDCKSNDNVDLMIANSAFVRERIRKYYGCDAEVVHPFVDLEDFHHLRSADESVSAKTDEYVMVTAFAPNKRVDLAIEAFNRMKKPLTIIGGGQLDRELRAMAGPTIKFLGSVSRAEVIEVLARGRALIFPGVEDFGITPLEALAAGTPVVAYRAGGVLETLTDEDSVFFDEATPESLIRAIDVLEREPRKPDFARLEKFSKERFKREIGEMIEVARGRRS